MHLDFSLFPLLDFPLLPLLDFLLPLLDIVIGIDIERLFDTIRHHFGTMLRGVIKAIVEKNKLEDVKEYLDAVYPELEGELRTVHSYGDLIHLVRHNCFFTNIRMLESLAETFAMDIPEVWKLLTKFKEEKERLYEQVLAKDFVKDAMERVRASHAKVMFVCHVSYF